MPLCFVFVRKERRGVSCADFFTNFLDEGEEKEKRRGGKKRRGEEREKADEKGSKGWKG